MQYAKHFCTPASSSEKLDKTQCPSTEEEKQNMTDIPYHSAVGSLLYAASGTRPDIAWAVNRQSQFNQNPGWVHWDSLKRVLRYVKKSIDRGIQYTKGNHKTGDPIRVQIFSDSDWANDSDDRRSTTGYIVMFTGGPVIWNSKKQRTVAHSSCEAEYMAMDEAIREAMWVRSFLQELDIPFVQPLEMYVDNQGAKALAENPVHHARVKHIDIRYHYIRDRVADGVVKVMYIPTEDNISDVLTKPLGKTKFKDLTDVFMQHFSDFGD
jgi:hypothetical protein